MLNVMLLKTHSMMNCMKTHTTEITASDDQPVKLECKVLGYSGNR